MEGAANPVICLRNRGTARDLRRYMRTTILALLLVLAACEGPAGPQGPAGTDGSAGSQGAPGAPGQDGSGAPPAPWLTGDDLKVAVTGLSFDGSAAHVAFTLTDKNGDPLDRAGQLTEGAVGVSFVLAQLAQHSDGTPGQYTAYTTTTQTSPITHQTATQAALESKGTFTTVDVTKGTYTYTFAAPLTGLQPALTQTVLAVATRTAGGVSSIDRTLFSARPDGGTPQLRQEVTDGTCGGCHGTSLATHGGRYTSPSQCILCHTPQSSDPDTGNTVDFKVMIHKIHRGAELPSVVAGGAYQIIGYKQAVSDFSTVEFPQDIARCTACHAGAQPDVWGQQPSKAACTSCHDTTSFVSPPPAGMVLHGGGAQPDDAPCAVCHPQTGSIAGILDKHFVGRLAPTAQVPSLTIQSIANTAPGQVPVVTFQVKTCQPNATPAVACTPLDILATPLTRLSATIAGPTTDETTAWQGRIQGSGAVGTLAAVDEASGVFSYTFPATGAIPAGATGSYEVGLEGYSQAATPGAVRYPAPNPAPLVFAVTDASPMPRRTIVDVAKCDGCHYQVSAHGGMRNDPAYCVECHNTSLQSTPSIVPAGSSVLGFTIDFRSMIHKIHSGENLAQGYQIGSSNFSDVRYPRPTTDCAACHVGKNWTLPMANSPAYAPSQQTVYACAPGTSCTFANNVWTPAPAMTPAALAPQTSVCTSCHDAPYTAAHAQLNTTSDGTEACATCHGPGMDWDVAKFHGTP